MSIYQFIKQNKLQPADVVEMVCPSAGFPKHYAVYIGIQNGQPAFIANITSGVCIIKDKELLNFMAKYQVTSIEKFNGSMSQRMAVLKRAISRIGEKAYCLVFNNCEHFKNWVLYNDSTSKQVVNIGLTTVLAGISLCIVGAGTNKKVLQKAGLFVILLPLIIFVIAFLMLTSKTK